MCGFAGFVDTTGARDARELEALAERMAATLRHRGPDDRGVWADREAGVVLGHRRLSIIDLTQSGHQPMTSPGGRYVIAYNGEVYNFSDLRKTLDEAQAIRNTELAEELALPPVKIHCSVLAEDAINAAVEDYLKKNS